ncbi:inositol monophosphatase family protein [Nocardiopsis nanhaiensis]
MVDAIDGTRSFLAGEPEWGTLIALTRGRRVDLGLVSAPSLESRWWAGSGGGAWTATTPTPAGSYDPPPDCQCHGPVGRRVGRVPAASGTGHRTRPRRGGRARREVRASSPCARLERTG